MALWSGTPSYATKKQLVSSISGLYDDLQDFQFSTISQVSTLNVSQWISTPLLYVSDIVGANISISGITISQDGVFNAPIVSLSSLSFKGLDKLLDVDLSFDLGLGDAIGGLLGGLGAAVGGAFIAVGTGVGLAIQGAEQGIATMVAGRPQNYINSNVYETINFTTQLQISTLGNAYPLYSTIRREVSSLSADSVPGREIFTSTFFTPGTTCIRSVSDPFQLITGNSNLNTSSLQSFGQWVPLPSDAGTPTNGEFSTLVVQYLDGLQPPLQVQNLESIYPNIFTESLTIGTSNSFNLPWNSQYPLQGLINNTSPFFSNTTYHSSLMTFVSSPYIQFQSTITTSALYYLTSSISTPAFFTYSNNASLGNFAICEVDETGFRSTATFDFQAISQDLFIQWGLGVDNRNSTIGAGTAKRVTWDNTANTSNFEDIPVPISTTISQALSVGFGLETNPYEVRMMITNNAGQDAGLKINTSTMRVGTGFLNSSASNQPGYAFQFDGNTYINGILEAQTIIAVSSIIAVSTFSQTLFSTNIIEAETGDFGTTTTTEAFMKDGYISTLKASSNFANDYITTLSRVRMAGFQTPLSIVTGKTGNVYDYTHCFDFQTNSFPQQVSVIAKPNLNAVMTLTSTNVTIPNLNVGNLVAQNLVYSNAEAPYLEVSTINFGWTGNFTYGGAVDFSLQQYLSTPIGTYWNNYAAASNQILNIMNFNNQVNMLAQQFSTPLAYATNTTFGGSNREGWASTIFYNATGQVARVNLASNAGPGELSLQASQNNIAVNLNTFGASNLGGVPIPIVVPSTLRFVSDGSQWNVSYIPPQPGNVSYSNTFQMTMDFENLNISTSDTLNINAETINLNGQVVAPNLQLENIILDGYLSSTQVRVDSTNGYVSQTDFVGSLNNSGVVTPMNLQFNVNSTDFTNIRNTITPSRGFNLFNSFNLAEWNNTQFNIDTNTAAGRPTMIVGEVLQLSPPTAPYAGQFWVNNTIDAPALVIPIYQNVEGVLNQIGSVTGGTIARVYTANGSVWSIQSNVPSPQGSANVTYNNYYQVQMNSGLTTINSGMPLIYNNPSLTYYNNKTFFYSPQIRVATIDAQSFNTREAGMEYALYYDSNISFSKIGATSFWESAAFNPVLNIYANTYYSVAGWEPYVSMTRLRISGNAISSWDLEATPYPVGGGATDYVWGTARYVKIITDELNPSGNLRESYLMIPKNYFNFVWQGQGPIN